MKSDVAILVYKPLRKKRKDNSFDGNSNIGAHVINDVLINNGMAVSHCSPSSASKFKVVLISLTSTFDLFAFYKSVSLLPSWKKGVRSFVVICGGFGVQNPTTIRDYIDYAVFGRAEKFIHEMVTAIIDRKGYDRNSVLDIDKMNFVEYEQTDMLYPDTVRCGKLDFNETFIGCKNKCKFCHYTWARKHLGTSEEYINETLAGSISPELTWKQLIKTEGKLGRVRSAIDGFSERLRFKYGKRITNDDVIAGIERLGAYGGNTVCILYNISNMPTETDEDAQEFYELMAKAKPESRVIIVLHSTPFRPSLITPMQWEPAKLLPNWSSKAASVVFDSDKLRVVHSTGNEAPYSHLMSLVAERANNDSDALFKAMCFHPALQKGRSEYRVRIIAKSFDISRYTKRYDVGDYSFSGVRSRSYISNDVLEKAATKMREAVLDGAQA